MAKKPSLKTLEEIRDKYAEKLFTSKNPKQKWEDMARKAMDQIKELKTKGEISSDKVDVNFESSVDFYKKVLNILREGEPELEKVGIKPPPLRRTSVEKKLLEKRINEPEKKSEIIQKSTSYSDKELLVYGKQMKEREGEFKPVLICVIDTKLYLNKKQRKIAEPFLHQLEDGSYGRNFAPFTEKKDEKNIFTKDPKKGFHAQSVNRIIFAPWVKILNVVWHAEGSGSADSMAMAIDFCVQNNVDAINISGGGLNYSKKEHYSVKKGLRKGIKFFASAGNEGQYLVSIEERGPKYHPGVYPGVKTIGNAYKDDKGKLRLASSSNYARLGSEEMEDVALGRVGVEGWDTSRGTSQAVAHPTREYGEQLFKKRNPGFSWDKVEESVDEIKQKEEVMSVLEQPEIKEKIKEQFVSPDEQKSVLEAQAQNPLFKYADAPPPEPSIEEKIASEWDRIEKPDIYGPQNPLNKLSDYAINE